MSKKSALVILLVLVLLLPLNWVWADSTVTEMHDDYYYATIANFQTKTFYDGSRYWVFYLNSTSERLNYRSSLDASSWSSETTFTNTDIAWGYFTDQYFNGSHIFLAYYNETGTDSVGFSLGTISENSIAWTNTTVTPWDPVTSNMRVAITLDGSDDIPIIVYAKIAGLGTVNITKANNVDGSSWGSHTEFATDLVYPTLIPLDNGATSIVGTGTVGNKVLAWIRNATGTFVDDSDLGDIATGEYEWAATGNGTHVMLTWLDGTTMRYRVRDNTASACPGCWSAATVVEGTITDDSSSYPTVAGFCAERFFLFYEESDVIRRKDFNGSAWEDESTVLTELATLLARTLTVAKKVESNYLTLAWVNNTESQYQVRHHSIEIEGCPLDNGNGGAISTQAMNWWIMLVGFLCFVSPPFVIAKRRHGEAANVVVLLFVMVIGLALIGAAVS